MTVKVSPSNTVTVEKIMLTDGRPTMDQKTTGAYSIRVLDAGAGISWERQFDLNFDYFGPRVKGVDYSNVSYDYQPVTYRIPYSPTMKKLEMYHDGKLIFSNNLDFCNGNGICDTTETYQTCPGDCPLDKKDTVCAAVKDSICDPDCLPGVDPDCTSTNPTAGTQSKNSIPVNVATILCAVGAAAGCAVVMRRK
jgi:hypothetical protein